MAVNKFAEHVNIVANLDSSLAMDAVLHRSGIALKVGSAYDVVSELSIYNRSTKQTEHLVVNGIMTSTNIDVYLASVETAITTAYPIVVTRSSTSNGTQVATLNTIDVGLALSGSEYYIRDFNINISLSGVEQYDIDAELVNPLELTPSMLNLTPEFLLDIQNVTSTAALITENIDEILLAYDNAAIASTKAEEALASANLASYKAAQIQSLTISATTLLPGASATASYNSGTGMLSLGIPACIKGDKGDTGLQGMQGVKGDTGDPGIQGVQGLPGVDGHTITSITSNKVGKDTTVTVAGTFPSSPAVFHVLDGADGSGAGDMLKSVYDSTDNGKVDVAEVAESVAWANVSGKPSIVAINDIVPSLTDVYSSQRTQDLHNAQQEAIASLSGASASFFSDTPLVVPGAPVGFVDLEWTNNQASTNSDIFTLGTNEINFYKDGNYSFLNTLTFYRLSDDSSMTVTFEMYDADVLSVISTANQPIDMTAGTKETVPFNAVISISGATSGDPVRMKVRMQATPANGTLELFSFNSILVAQAVVDVVNIETDPVFTAWDKSTGISITKSQVSDFPTAVSVFTNDAGYITSAYHDDTKSDATHNHSGTYEPAIASGSTDQYIRGDKSLAIMPTALPASDVYAWAKAATKPTYTSSEVGLGNVSNEAQVTSVTASGVLSSSGGTTPTITHSTADGHLHVPATGTTNAGKVLTAGPSAGSLSWETPAVIDLTVTAGTTAGPTINSSTGADVVIPSASATASGVVTTGDQTFAGVKTMTSPVLVTPSIGVATGTSFNSITGLASVDPVAPAVTAAVGTSTLTARQDHVHPTNFTDTATDIKMNGTQAVGTLTTFPRADHVHPTDTSRAPLDSPALTGTPTAPTATGTTNTTQVATTAHVKTAYASTDGTLGGVVKMRISGSTLYIRNDGIDA